MSGILAFGRGNKFADLVLDINNTVNPNIASLLSAAGWDGLKHVKLIVDPATLVNTLVIPNTTFAGGLALEGAHAFGFSAGDIAQAQRVAEARTAAQGAAKA